MGTPRQDELTTIALRQDTHRRIKSLKRGGESFDTLVSRMAAQYDPERP